MIIKIAYLPRHGTSWADMEEQYRFVAKDQRFSQVFLLANPEMDAKRTICEKEGYDAVSLVKGTPDDPFCQKHPDEDWRILTQNLPGPLSRLLQAERVAHGLVVGFWKKRRIKKVLRIQQRRFEELFAEIKPDILMVPGDRELAPVAPALRAAKNMGIASIISVSFVPTVEGVSISRRGKARFQTRLLDFPPVLNIVQAIRFPEQVSGGLLFSPGWLISALKDLGMLSAYPWCQGGGNSSFVFVDTAKKYDDMENIPAASAKRRLIGDLSHDRLFTQFQKRQELIAEFGARYGFEKNRKTIVVAVPQHYEHGMLDWPTHENELRQLFKILRMSGQNILLSLHPKSERWRYQDLADQQNLPIVEERLFDVLPLADIFVASASSTTIDWAIMLGIPAINMDTVDFADPAYDDCPGVLYVTTFEEIQKGLSKLVESNAFYEECQESQRARAEERGLGDGHAGERFIGALFDIAQKGATR